MSPQPVNLLNLRTKQGIQGQHCPSTAKDNRAYHLCRIHRARSLVGMVTGVLSSHSRRTWKTLIPSCRLRLAQTERLPHQTHPLLLAATTSMAGSRRVCCMVSHTTSTPSSRRTIASGSCMDTLRSLSPESRCLSPICRQEALSFQLQIQNLLCTGRVCVYPMKLP